MGAGVAGRGFRIWSLGGLPVVTLPAEIDIGNAGLLREALASAGAGHATIVVDMTGTEFCDSSAISELITAMKRAHADGGDLRLVVARRAVQKIFAVTGMMQVFTIFDSLPQALAAPTPMLAPAVPES
jgi:anti-sigma B factor antagonist